MIALSDFWWTCAQKLTLFALENISIGQPKIISKYKDPPQVVEFGDKNKPAVTIVVRDLNAWRRICACFDLGFAEAYMFQEVDCDSLSGLFDNKTQLGSGNFLMQSLPRLTMLLQPSNDPQKCPLISPPITTIPTNYSPTFFSSDMNYSRAHWSGDPTETLETAQKTKVQLDASDREVEAFCRKWLYYFIYCEAGLRLRLLGKYTVVAAKTPEARMEYDARLGKMLME